MLEDAADLLGDFVALYKAINACQVQIHGLEEQVSLLQGEARVADSLNLLHADMACLHNTREWRQQAEQERDDVAQQFEESQERNRSLQGRLFMMLGDLEDSQSLVAWLPAENTELRKEPAQPQPAVVTPSIKAASSWAVASSISTMTNWDQNSQELLLLHFPRPQLQPQR